jgi:uncharacterized protein Veg
MGVNTIDSMSIEEIRKRVKEIYKISPIIHVNVVQKRRSVKNATARIKGIYGLFICVESEINHYLEEFTISYIDLLTKNIIIQELVIEN